MKRIGVLEFDTLPSELADHLAAAAPAVEFVDGGALFAGLRRTIDDSERSLLRRADALAVAALAQPEAASDAGTLCGLIEKHARLNGAEEAFIHIAPDLGADRRLNRTSQRVPLAERYAVRASVAYKGCWVRRTRTFGKDTAKAEAWLQGLTFEAGASLASQLASHVQKLPNAELKDWAAESCIGSYPLSVVASPRAGISFAPAAGGFFVLTVELSVNGAPWIGAKPIFVK